MCILKILHVSGSCDQVELGTYWGGKCCFSELIIHLQDSIKEFGPITWIDVLKEEC